MSFLSGLLFIMLGLGSDGAPPLVQLRTPPPAMMGLPNLPDSLGGYSYLVMKLGPLQLTRKGLSVASTAACLTFTASCFLFPYFFIIYFNSVRVQLNTLLRQNHFFLFYVASEGRNHFFFLFFFCNRQIFIIIFHL